VGNRGAGNTVTQRSRKVFGGEYKIGEKSLGGCDIVKCGGGNRTVRKQERKSSVIRRVNGEEECLLAFGKPRDLRGSNAATRRQVRENGGLFRGLGGRAKSSACGVFKRTRGGVKNTA